MDELTLARALSGRRSVRAFSKKPLKKAAVLDLLQTVQGETDDAGHRAVPSAHALYPLRYYVVAGQVIGVDAGLYTTSPDAQDLTEHKRGDVRPDLKAAAVDDQTWIEQAPCTITICGDAAACATHFADQTPYGERGMRYLYLEAGAAAQTLLLAAVNMGLGSVLVAGFKDEETSKAMELAAPLVPIAHICLGYA